MTKKLTNICDIRGARERMEMLNERTKPLFDLLKINTIPEAGLPFPLDRMEPLVHELSHLSVMGLELRDHLFDGIESVVGTRLGKLPYITQVAHVAMTFAVTVGVFSSLDLYDPCVPGEEPYDGAYGDEVLKELAGSQDVPEGTVAAFLNSPSSRYDLSMNDRVERVLDWLQGDWIVAIGARRPDGLIGFQVPGPVTLDKFNYMLRNCEGNPGREIVWITLHGKVYARNEVPIDIWRRHHANPPSSGLIEDCFPWEGLVE